MVSKTLPMWIEIFFACLFSGLLAGSVCYIIGWCRGWIKAGKYYGVVSGENAKAFRNNLKDNSGRMANPSEIKAIKEMADKFREMIK